MNQYYDELEDVTKNAPMRTKLPRSNMSTINFYSHNKNILIPSKKTLSVQSMSPTINQISLSDNDDLLDDFGPFIQDQTRISVNVRPNTPIRCSLPDDLFFEQSFSNGEGAFNGKVIFT